MVLKARQTFQFPDKRPSFSETLGLSLNFCMGFCTIYLELSNYKK